MQSPSHPYKLALRALRSAQKRPIRTHTAFGTRSYHHSPCICAASVSADVQGPPPASPYTAVRDRLAWKKQREEMLSGKIRDMKEAGTLTRRFWKDVHVVEVPDGYQIHLDKRPVRAPTDKSILTIPRTKPHLAHAIAVEWDSLTLAKHALKPHLIPLTGLVDRTLDILRDDARGARTARDDIADTVMRYFDTDTLLSWAPGAEYLEHPNPLTLPPMEPAQGDTLRAQQIRAAQQVVQFLQRTVWPGTTIQPALTGASILPAAQPAATVAAVRKWVRGLGPYDLAGLERAALASKSLLVAARLVVEWSENFRRWQGEGGRGFGLEEAARVATLEVAWQTGRWGEVEDTHDVDREDVRRQLGSAVLLVCGEGE